MIEEIESIFLQKRISNLYNELIQIVANNGFCYESWISINQLLRNNSSRYSDIKHSKCISSSMISIAENPPGYREQKIVNGKFFDVDTSYNIELHIGSDILSKYFPYKTNTSIVILKFDLNLQEVRNYKTNLVLDEN